MEHFGRKFNWKKEDFNNLKMIHQESMRNNRYHLRISFHDSNAINKIIRLADETKQQDVFKIKIDKGSYICEIMDNTLEKFKIVTLKNNVNKNVILVKMKNSNIFDIICHLSKKFCIDKINYVTINNQSSFIKFLDYNDMNKVIKGIKRDNIDFKMSATSIVIEKISPTAQITKHAIPFSQMKDNVSLKRQNSGNKNKIVKKSNEDPQTSQNNQESTEEISKIKAQLDKLSSVLEDAVKTKNQELETLKQGQLSNYQVNCLPIRSNSNDYRREIQYVSNQPPPRQFYDPVPLYPPPGHFSMQPMYSYSPQIYGRDNSYPFIHPYYNYSQRY